MQSRNLKKERNQNMKMIKVINESALEFSKKGEWSTKFGCNVAAYFYQCSLDGDGETIETIEEDGISCIKFEVSDDEREALNIQWHEAYLFEDDKGFVTAQACI